MAYVGLFTGLASLGLGILGEPGSPASMLSALLLPFTMIATLIAAMTR
jgi:hypothetical protein